MAKQFVVRSLERSDYDKGYLQLLGQLTDIGDVNRVAFNVAFDTISSNPLHRVFVIEDKGKIIGCITLFIEQKFARSCGRCGHIEDVVTDSSYRGKGLGKLVTDYAVQYAKQNGCYKVILDCSDKNVPFYERCGFKKKENQCALYFSKL
eukprot:CAMPEP_0197057214 /NCGR_PEP_ID=MMETSP1384-20130603/94301_1 /TAXON_ID=29189 /ORGANISM="Ammonia sp." /LENGTH=148 /DNA_ID=CAMNT_0042491531 /DNA_START=31 /DNA_END=477 /DNA_ORIENTATION=+